MTMRIVCGQRASSRGIRSGASRIYFYFSPDLLTEDVEFCTVCAQQFFEATHGEVPYC